MMAETFSRGNSFIHRLHPQTRLASVVIYSVLISVCQQFTALGAALAASLILTAMTSLDFRLVLRKIILANKFILLLWVILPFSAGQWSAGLGFAAVITLKSNAIMLALIALATTCPADVIGQVLSRWSVPDKFVYLLLLSYRYLFVIRQERDKLMTAVRLRGFQPGLNLETCRTHAYLIGALLVRASLRAERVRQAMICRGFTGKFYCLREFRFSAKDSIFLGGASIVISTIVILEWKEIILSLI